MKKQKLKKTTIYVILFVIIINVFSMIVWFQFRIKPMTNRIGQIKEEITETELSNEYQEESELLEDIATISKKYNIKYSITDIYDHELIKYTFSNDDICF